MSRSSSCCWAYYWGVDFVFSSAFCVVLFFFLMMDFFFEWGKGGGAAWCFLRWVVLLLYLLFSVLFLDSVYHIFFSSPWFYLDSPCLITIRSSVRRTPLGKLRGCDACDLHGLHFSSPPPRFFSLPQSRHKTPHPELHPTFRNFRSPSPLLSAATAGGWAVFTCDAGCVTCFRNAQ